jgi:hypothetical protein
MEDSGPIFVTRSEPAEATDSSSKIQAMDFKAFVRRGVVPPSGDRALLMQYLHGLSIDAAMHGDYAKADYYSDINKQFYEACIEKDGRESVKHQLDTIEEQIMETRKQSAELKAQLDAELRDVEWEEKARIENMKAHHAKELTEFDEKWASEQALRPFSKPSAFLAELREKEKKLLLIKEFIEAAAVGKYADSVEKEEIRAAQIEAEREAIFHRRQLMEKHEQEIFYMEQRAMTRLAVLKKNHDEKLQILTARMAHIEIDKLNVRRSKTATTDSVAVKPRIGQTGGLLSPRSHGKLEAYRKRSVVSRLVLKPVEKFPNTLTRQLRMPKYKRKPLI